MIPLARKKFPDSKSDLAEALDSALRRFVKKDGDIVSVSARVFPYLDEIAINLDNAKLDSPPPPPPKPSGETKPACEAAQLSVSARKMQIEGAPLNLQLKARDIVFHEGRDANGDVVMLVHNLRSGHVHVSAAQLDLEKAIGEVAQREARKQGITIEQTRVTFRARGPRSLSADVSFAARKFLFRAKIDISGQMQIDEGFRAKLLNLKCRGDGTLGSLACGILEPHLRKLEGRSFSLMSLPLGDIRLSDVRIAVADSVEITADFSGVA
ncbi:MAG: hypothetical protein QOG48_1471 [Verrucomicrobiota bacterium]